MKTVLKIVLTFFYWAYRFIKNIKHLKRLTWKFNSLKNKDEIVIICNGPSAQSIEDEIVIHNNSDVLIVNDYPLKSKNFFLLKPKFLCLIDPAYYSDNGNNKVKQLKIKLELVDWELKIINFPNQTLNIRNDNITQIKINHNIFDGQVNKFVSMLYDSNLACMPINNVAIAAIFSAIKIGYKKIVIYGLDMSFHNEVFVDKDNNVIANKKHFYGSSVINFTSINSNVKNEGIQFFFREWYLNFYSFNQLRKYADIKKIDIINCNPDSYVDAFRKVDR